MYTIKLDIPDMWYETISKLYDLKCDFAQKHHWNMTSKDDYSSKYVYRLMDQEKIDAYMTELETSIDNMK